MATNGVVDVIVVGGGVSGTRTASLLADGGWKVHLLEANNVSLHVLRISSLHLRALTSLDRSASAAKLAP